jgi:hypothetical protein
MFKRIAIAGLGPHADFAADLDPEGTTLLSGPSEAGKSFVLEALVFVLWGRSARGKFAPEAIRDGGTKASVELTLASGRILRRSVTRSRAMTRSVVAGGQKTSYDNEPGFVAAIPEIGDDADAARLVIVPMSWESLIDGNARAFRDILARILPGGDVGAEVATRMALEGHAVRPGEATLSEKEAMERRRDAKRARDEAEGRRQGAVERVTALEALTAVEPRPVAPGDEELFARIAAWEAWDRASGDRGREAALAQQQAWDRRRSELGVEPSADRGHEGASERARQARATVDASTQHVQQVYGRYQFTAMQLQPYAGATDPSVCPVCRRPGWEHGAMAIAQLQGMASAVQVELAQVQARHQQATEALDQANADVVAARELGVRREAWQRATRALGPRPEVPEASTAQPEPTTPRPSPDEVAAARATAAHAASAEGVRRERVRDMEAAKTQARAESRRHAEADSETTRLDALLEAVRTVPSILAHRQALALGDLGPVALQFGDNPAVSILIDGRPWWLASRGRRIVADAWLRAGLRRALGRPGLPIVIDNTQDVKGQPLPAVGGPVILLHTSEGQGITVTRGMP